MNNLTTLRQVAGSLEAIMRLDTLPRMKSATALYESLGFARVPAYYATPLVDTVFMELKLGVVPALPPDSE